MEFLAKLALSAVVGLIIMGGCAVVGTTVLWWVAMLIGAAVVFGLWLILDSDDFGNGWS